MLKKGEWVVGIECSSTKKIELLIEAKSGKRRSIAMEFLREFTEEKNWHAVGNSTGKLITMVTLKKFPEVDLKKTQWYLS